MAYEIDQQESDRITILKGILIVFVVFIHSHRESVSFLEGNVTLIASTWLEWLKYLVSQVIARGAVPAFFLLSSILLYRREFTWKKNMNKKLNTILVPYIFLNSFWILFFYFAQYTEFGNPYLVSPQSRIREWGVIGWLDAYLGNFVDDYPALYQTWFLRDLFILNVFALFIKRCVDRFPKLILCVVTCIWLLPIPLPFIGGGELSGQSFVFFLLGYYIVKYDLHIRNCDRIPTLPLFVLYLSSIALTAMTRFSLLGYTCHHITILIGILCLAKISHSIEQGAFRNIYIWFSGHSFFIFAFHEMTLTIITKLLTRRIPQTVWVQFLEYIGLPIVVILLCIIGSIVVRKFLPGFYQMITGGRTGTLQ